MVRVKKKVGWQIEVCVCFVWGRNVNVYELREGVCGEWEIRETEGTTENKVPEGVFVLQDSKFRVTGLTSIQADLLCHKNGLSLRIWVMYHKSNPLKKIESIIQYSKSQSLKNEVTLYSELRSFITELLKQCFAHSRSMSELCDNES